MMDEIVYDLLLKSPLGFMLLGTLRARILFIEEAAAKRAGAASAPVPASLVESLGGALDRPSVQMDLQRVEGSIAVQFLTGSRPVPVEGIILGFGMYPLPLFGVLNSAEAPPITMQLSFLDATHIGGGIVWQPGTPRQLTFSLLGTQRGFGM
ncbi:hypothetical protein [Burkholderia sp. LMU1-1-1.1]|uniref:hypothetical protein n=1 Tax=Burkholderia sp. LMU1-1-1.1 TaxID=3135266 RepID=UPI003422CA22